MKISKDTSHIWKFSRVGGVNRVNIESGQDLLHLQDLDQKLWTALSCPVHGLEIDEKTLELIDTDKDGRIRVPEILEAVNWICSVVAHPDIIIKQEALFPVSALNKNTSEGKKLYASVKQILTNLDKPNATTISVDDTSDTIAIFSKTKFNGDGIITVNSSDNEALQTIIQNCIDTVGSVIDRSGNPGISLELLESFYTECIAYKEWHALSETNSAEILPFGDGTEKALSLFLAVKSKIDDYFMRCRIAAFDADSVTVLNTLTAQYEVITSKDLSSCVDEIATYPISKIQANKPLTFDTTINPAWEKAISEFKTDVVFKIFPKLKVLTEEDWNLICKTFEAYIDWKSKKVGAVVELLGIDSIKNIVSENKKLDIIALIDEDKALEAEANNIILVDKLVRYHRDLFTLLKNFVTFHDFYSPDEPAIFQTGTLFLDQRSLDLCIKVTDMPKHTAMANMSGMYLIYCDCTSKVLNEKMTILAALTNGDIDNVTVGRNALFYDRKGQDWDAVIVKIIENPISIRQAFWSPYRKVARFVETQVNKFASAKDNQLHAEATGKISDAANKAESTSVVSSSPVVESPKPAPQPFDIGKFVGIFAAIGMAIGAIGAVLASFISGFLQLTWWKMPIAMVGIILVISAPSMLIAWIKLHKRNLAPILDANGWAINARAIVNIAFGNTLTHLVKLPKNSRLDLKDPFATKTTPMWLKLIYFIIALGVVTAILWRFGYLVKWGWI